MNLLDSLNQAQKEAVTAPIDQHSAIISGAGTGKTRVLVHRISFLLQQGVDPTRILALTFTNKAAKEMRERLIQMVDPAIASKVFLGTFHSIGLRIIMRYGDIVGLPNPSRAQVLDTDDGTALFRRVMKNHLTKADLDLVKPSDSYNLLIKLKESGYTPSTIPPFTSNPKLSIISRLLAPYETEKTSSNAVDYADMIHVPNRIFCSHPEIAQRIQQGLSQILVDEFQDTNETQLEFLAHCSESEKPVPVFVVGDDDQSIYGFRGAYPGIFNDFLKTHQPCTMVRMEQNYRCHSIILDAANAVIANNTGRIGKTLFTQRQDADFIKVSQHTDGQAEAVSIANKISELIQSGISPSSIAILYRKNALSRLIEESLIQQGIPYQIFGGKTFYSRKEIKDALAILRLVVNPNDADAFYRCMERPPKGVGQSALDKIRALSHERRIPLFQAAQSVVQSPKFHDFSALIKNLRQLRDLGDFKDLVTQAVERSGLITYYSGKEQEKGEQRADNICELIKAAWEFHHRFHMGNVVLPDFPETGEHPHTQNSDALSLFLAETALYSGEQQSGRKVKVPSVQVMTIHKAKGLEFRHVFLVGLEQGEFPVLSYYDSPEDPDTQAKIEEERRIFYVAVTRAIDNLYFSFAVDRQTHDSRKDKKSFEVSQFLFEIPAHFYDRPISSFTKPLSLTSAKRLAIPGDQPKPALPGRHQEEDDDDLF